MRRSLLTLAVLALLAACGGGSDDVDTAATTTTKADGSTTTTTGKPTTTTSAGPGVTVKAAGEVDPGGYGWKSSANQYRGMDGKQLEFGCPPGGQVAAVYGTGTYTDDTSVCSAAVHAGKITPVAGGQVVVVVQPGQPSYTASTANGVDSLEFGEYAGSYSIMSAKEFAGTTDPQTGGYGWSATSTELRGLVGQQFEFSCPPDGTLSGVYGTGTYTDDTSVCSSAVHADKITKAQGGTVVIVIKGEQSSFTGSEANGITSNDYGAWPASFSFV